MLVSTRRVGDRVLIELDGVKVWVSVISIIRGKVQLGFDAPRKVKITRELSVKREEQT